MLTVDRTRPATSAGRIARVETLTLGTAWRDFSFVRIHTDEGLTGIGEITHPYRGRETCSLTHAMAERHLLGADPFDVEEIWLRMYQGDFLRGGDVGGVVLSGVDQALYDIMGRTLGVPAYRLMGGAVRQRVRVYANGWYTGERDPSSFAERARETVARGYTALKFDPFGAGLGTLDRAELRRSVEIVAAVRDAVGPDVDLFVEGHARFAMATADRLVRELAPFDLGWFEEPLPWTHIERYAELRATATMPIAGGEHFHNRYEYARLFAADAVDIVQPDLSMAGGPTEVRKIGAIADAHAMVVAPHNSNSPLCTTISVHSVAGMPNLLILETFDGALEPFVFEALRGVVPIEDGEVALPSTPGYGVELVDEVFEEHPPSHRFWNMFSPGWERRNRR
ncbi:mandelate racemase/muconate lactonizing enzyme family protein [Phytoactinopolyspora halotolerans]|uniref:Mandelate racemase/muconate lactonizing enzyme family protein n=1 Tax=Phytoactinopolyspora halotolerans TaxID=1981512 RepID=A0A6L9S8Q2_9ACTN|nr:mandelate racemase/muconate lactonizing enzyme family protein [Phytoactinopolyspora halotolerans]NEE01403.1 mandelate racemase/muconate lactonizing enzyme family protein [Phytoactinopolyspora halotolerans]